MSGVDLSTAYKGSHACTPDWVAFLILIRHLVQSPEQAPVNMSTAVEKTPDGVKSESQIEHGYDLDKNAKVSDYKADAIDAESAEAKLGVLEAVRAYPMASLWAFVMSCTIVSCLISFPPAWGSQLTRSSRSWSLTASS